MTIFFLSLVLSSFLAGAQTPEPAPQPKSSPPNKPSFIPFPILFSQPETGFGYGLAILPVYRLGADTLTRPSNARLLLYRTTEKQSAIQLTHNIFTAGEKLIISGELSYYYAFPVNYYGFGPGTALDDNSKIQYSLLIFNQRVLRRVVPHLFAGLQYRLTNLSDVRINTGTEDGRPSPLELRPLRERTQTTVSSGIGPSFLYDNRDNILSSFHGNYLEVSALFNGGALGSDNAFGRYQLDARHFQPLFRSERTILALQLLAQFHGGYVPFRELANLGGASQLRGYYEGRYRDRQLLAAQAEVRHHLFWRLNGAVFGGIGQVGDSLDSFGEGGLKVAGGGGIRFQFNRHDRLNARLDYGVGRGGSSGVYFSIGEAF
ncbi:BamA/TamA family outer membrane protein [Hymenobacter rubidus]|uniref:BamA/TamA family outer membrane protein n=1 Tax=Hymenobacter rubidus TaxID=1441626 RepID=UPI00191E63B3|nr:BamA/TamA family outer membrane protein [Hymenobacter rubidus]